MTAVTREQTTTDPAATDVATDVAPEVPAEIPGASADELVEDQLVEDVSIDGMCGVY